LRGPDLNLIVKFIILHQSSKGMGEFEASSGHDYLIAHRINEIIVFIANIQISFKECKTILFKI